MIGPDVELVLIGIVGSEDAGFKVIAGRDCDARVLRGRGGERKREEGEEEERECRKHDDGDGYNESRCFLSDMLSKLLELRLS